MWKADVERLALLELLARGKLRRRQAQAQGFDLLGELAWTRATGRRDELRLVEERREELVSLIERAWPDWREALVELTELGLPPTPEGWGRLQDIRRARSIPTLPARVNRRTAAAITAPHSKATLTESRRASLGEAEPTHDGSVRLRPPPGLRARSRAGTIELSAVADVLGEIAIPERAFLDGLVLEGDVRALLLIENLGAWRDLSAPPGWLLAHVPGWDTATAAHLLEHMPSVTAIHFGDLDPNGVRIYLHLRERRPELLWFLPDFWFERAEEWGQPAAWPPELDLAFAPAAVRDLARRGLWLEQERIALDPRVGAALERCLSV